DITGFGLLGHAAEMAKGSQVGMTIRSEHVPVLPRTRELAEMGIIPGGSKENYHWLSDCVTYDERIDDVTQHILCDAVTSGGLLIALNSDEAATLLADLHRGGIEAKIVGEVT